MEPDSRHTPTYLFMIRLWSEALGDGRAEWRGQVQHVLSGEAHYFREWSALVELLRTMLPLSEEDGWVDGES